MQYDALKQHAAFHALTRLQDLELAAIAAAHPDLPSDYTEFLREIGWGKVADVLMIYSGPVAPSDVYDPETASALGRLLLIGDDFAGQVIALDPAGGGSVVEIDPSAVPERIADTFGAFVLRDLVGRVDAESGGE